MLTIEYQKDKKINAKHAVEEAMTNALIHFCNKCRKGFLKESGCNKMTCPCGNFQCYVCRQNITSGYNHFGPGKCQLYEDTAEKQKRRVADAQGKAVNNVLQQRDDVTEADLTVDNDLMAKKKKAGSSHKEPREVGGIVPDRRGTAPRMAPVRGVRPQAQVSTPIPFVALPGRATQNTTRAAPGTAPFAAPIRGVPPQAHVPTAIPFVPVVGRATQNTNRAAPRTAPNTPTRAGTRGNRDTPAGARSAPTTPYSTGRTPIMVTPMARATGNRRMERGKIFEIKEHNA